MPRRSRMDTVNAVAGSAGTPADEVSERDQQILAFERQWWRYAGAKEQAIRDLFGMSATRYYQVLNALIDRPEALRHDPMLVKRLRRMRAARQRARAARRLGLDACPALPARAPPSVRYEGSRDDPSRRLAVRVGRPRPPPRSAPRLTRRAPVPAAPVRPLAVRRRGRCDDRLGGSALARRLVAVGRQQSGRHTPVGHV